MHLLRFGILSLLANGILAGLIRETNINHALAIDNGYNASIHYDNSTSFAAVKRQQPPAAYPGPRMWFRPLTFGSNELGNNHRLRMFLGRLIKDRSNRQLCDLVQGYEGDVSFEYSAGGSQPNCNGPFSASTMAHVLRQILNEMMWSAIDGGCIELWHLNTFRGHLQLMGNNGAIRPELCKDLGGMRPWEDKKRWREVECDICGAAQNN
ncbi:MAG: hypothetical protein LQ345_000481 [Seirophora villosa]|nr:MAG: hypothetical protein LQ345_000481 [Seirophora villosa]